MKTLRNKNGLNGKKIKMGEKIRKWKSLKRLRNKNGWRGTKMKMVEMVRK